MSRCVLFWLVSLSVVASLQAQTSTPGSTGNVPIFQSKVLVVLVDVVVTSGKGEAIPGLHQEDFQVMEDGKPQIISSFEEHKGAPPTQVDLPSMPPNVYTNYPRIKTSDSVNVLLLDSLNTQPKDQVYVHAQVVKYLNHVRPGTRLAIFTLGSRLRMLKGVTADSSGLLAAIDPKKGGANPQFSRLLPTAFQKDTDKQLIDVMIMNRAGPEAIDALRQYQAEESSSLIASRALITLQALQQLALYLSPIPGRKNVIWVSGSFPINIFPEANRPHHYQGDIQQTADMLTAGQVAVYPIAAEGLRGDSLYDPGLFDPPSLEEEGAERAAHNIAMEKLAQDTGGRAFYNSNGLADAVTHAINDGSRYYTLTYTPSDRKMDRKYRRIQVKLLTGKYNLAYRRGYYAEDAKAPEAATQRPPADSLSTLMGFGLPDFSQIIYKVRVLAKDPRTATDTALAGGNTDLQGPLTRYGVDFAISIDDLKLDETPDGMRHGSMHIMLIAYDREGKPLNLVSQKREILLHPKEYVALKEAGLQVHQEIDVPKGDFYLRTGIYDLNSHHSGTLGVPLIGTSGLSQ